MRILRNSKLNRRAAAAVEFAFVAPIVFLLLFGILEWCRYVMIRNVTENAVREGARFALARTDSLQTNITTADIVSKVTTYIKASGSSLTNLQVSVYKTNVFGQPMDAYDNVVSSTSSAGTFDQTSFGDYICVTVTGTYQPVLPSFLHMSGLTQVTATCVMCSEGN
jgi:Flp pilus assembly protein TadG